jgi:hypothetical protein
VTSTQTSPVKGRVSTKVVVAGIFVVALILAGVVSFYASSNPDGLNRVALDKGFSDTEKDHATADGPFAGYGSSFISNESRRPGAGRPSRALRRTRL